ncbi:hypothetical protein BC831DRAFT_258400 [Entophlyctis helioformis]|nr:hypothetical protein BC831DRAFT_258400 [Entophlyctis helioformis]
MKRTLPTHSCIRFHQMQSQAPYPTASTAGTTASHGYQPRSLMARGPSTITSPAVVKSLAFNAQPSDAINASESLWSSQVVSQPDDLPPAHASLHSIHSRTNSGGSSFGSNGSNSGSSSSARTSVRSSIACTCSASSPLGEMCPACTLAAASSASSGAVNGGHRGSFGSGGGGPTSAATGSAGYMNGFMNRTRIHTSGAGYNPDLSRPSPFRRHSLDTFASCPAGQYDALLVSHMGQLPHGLLSPTSPTTRRSSASSAASSSTLYTNDHPLSRKGQPTAAVECKDPSIGPSPSTAAPEAGSTGGVAQAPPCETTSPRDMRIVAEIQTSNFPVDSAKLTSEYFDCLTREAQRLCIELVPSQEMFQLQRTVFLMLQDAVRLVFSDAVLDCAGAIVSGFSQPGAELDFCLVLPSISGSVAACGAQYIERLGNALKNAGIKEIKVLTRARVPICKLRDPMTGIPCDIGIQSSLWTHITRLLRTYACIDSRVQELSIVSESWAVVRVPNEPCQLTRAIESATGPRTVGSTSRPLAHCRATAIPSCSSTCCSCEACCRVSSRLSIQTRRPCWDRRRPSWPTATSTCTFMTTCRCCRVSGWETTPKQWASCWLRSFKYYACEFPYVHGVVSIRTGSVLSKDDKGWTKQVRLDAGL